MSKNSAAELRRSFRNQKKQARLTFSPLPSSSPAKESYNEAIQNRLANVRFAGSRSRRQGPASQQVGSDSLPTPEPSSQVGLNEQRSAPSPMPAPRASDQNETGQDSEEEEDDLIPPSSKRRRTNNAHSVLSNSSPTRRSSRLRHSSPLNSTTPSSSHRMTSRDPIGTSRMVEQAGHLSDIGSVETSDDEDTIMASRPKQNKRSYAKKINDPFVVDDNDENDLQNFEDEPPRKASTIRRRSHPEQFVVADDEVEYITSDEDEQIRKSSSSRKKDKSPRTPRRKDRDMQELQDDLDDLRDSDDDLAIQSSRTRGGPVTSMRDKTREHFELLKRRRAGERIPRVQDSDDEEEDQDQDSLEGRDISLIGQPDPEMLEESSPESSVQEVDGNDLDPEDNIDDFIEEDTSDRRGRPHPDIPLEFTQFASAKPRELFVYIVEWLIKNKLAPAFSRHDDLYNLAFSRIDDQVKAQAGSRLISSAWNATFKYTILARPNISISLLPGLDEDNLRTCDACNKTNRPARYDFILSGAAYSQNSLEPVQDSDDEDAFDDGASRDERGHILAREEHHFYLGSHCAANAQMGHKLTHWKFHLNESVLAYLEEQGVLSAESIVGRDKMNKKQREKQAEAIVDSMEDTGKIAELWRDFQDDMDDARLGMEDYSKRGGRSHGRIGVIRSSGTDGVIREWRDNKYTETRRLESDSEGE